LAITPEEFQRQVEEALRRTTKADVDRIVSEIREKSPGFAPSYQIGSSGSSSRSSSSRSSSKSSTAKSTSPYGTSVADAGGWDAWNKMVAATVAKNKGLVPNYPDNGSLIPIRQTMENLGYQVNYNPESRVISLFDPRSGRTGTISPDAYTIKNNKAYINPSYVGSWLSGDLSSKPLRQDWTVPKPPELSTVVPRPELPPVVPPPVPQMQLNAYTPWRPNPNIRLSSGEEVVVPTLPGLNQWYGLQDSLFSRYMAQEEQKARQQEIAQKIEEARREAALERWKIAGEVLTDEDAAILGVPKGTKTSDQRYNDVYLSIQRQKAASSRGTSTSGIDKAATNEAIAQIMTYDNVQDAVNDFKKYAGTMASRGVDIKAVMDAIINLWPEAATLFSGSDSKEPEKQWWQFWK